MHWWSGLALASFILQRLQMSNKNCGTVVDEQTSPSDFATCCCAMPLALPFLLTLGLSFHPPLWTRHPFYDPSCPKKYYKDTTTSRWRHWKGWGWVLLNWVNQMIPLQNLSTDAKGTPRQFTSWKESRVLLGCPRKLGSMVSKWVISPTYIFIYGVHWGEITHWSDHLWSQHFLSGTSFP